MNYFDKESWKKPVFCFLKKSLGHESTDHRTLTVWRRITVRLVSSLTWLDSTKKNVCWYLYVLKLLNPNQSNRRPVVLPPMASVLWIGVQKRKILWRNWLGNSVRQCKALTGRYVRPTYMTCTFWAYIKLLRKTLEIPCGLTNFLHKH